MGSRRPLAVAAVALVLAIGLVAWVAARFLGDDETEVQVVVASDSDSSRSAGTHGPEADDATAGDRSHRVDATLASRANEPTPALDPLAPVDRDALEAIESRGRALFHGVVTDFDGAPCAGAAIWHDGVRVGASDELGRYRVEVEQETWNPHGGTDLHRLAAAKDGTGTGFEDCTGGSRRIDLELRWRAVFAGRCVDRRSSVPIPGAEVHLLSYFNDRRTALFGSSVRADEKGGFRFTGVAPGIIELLAEADGFASDGWFAFDVSSGKDRLNIEFQLEPIMHAHGWFVPWPPPWLAREVAADACVVATPGKGREGGPDLEPIVARVADDGAFDVEFATCYGIDFALEVPSGSLWCEHLPAAFEAKDVDFGRISLAQPPAVIGTVKLPREVLELELEFLVVSQMKESQRHFRFPVGLDGGFRADLLSPTPLMWGVTLGDRVVIEDTLVSLYQGRGSGRGTELEAGSVLDLGELTTDNRWLFGVVCDASGRGVSGAMLQIPLRLGDTLMPLESRTSDSRGRFVMDLSRLDQWVEQGLENPELTLFGRFRRLTGRVPLPSRVLNATVLRCDVKLDEGLVLKGRAFDASGRPFANGQLDFMPDWIKSNVPLWFIDHPVTDAEGAFEADGLMDIDYLVTGNSEVGSATFGRVRPSETPVTLTPKPAE